VIKRLESSTTPFAENTRKLLTELAQECGLEARRDAMLAGARNQETGEAGRTLSSLLTATVVVLSQFSGMDQVVQWLTVALTGTTLVGTVLLLIVKLLTIRWRAREANLLAEGKGGASEVTDSTGIPLELSSFSSSTNGPPTHPHHDSGGPARTLSYPLLTMPSTNSNPHPHSQTLSPHPLQGKSKYHSANSSSGYNPLRASADD
jgi:hypothetical protein